MKYLVLTLILVFTGVRAFPQAGFGMGVHIPLNNPHAQQKNNNIENEVQAMKKDLALDSSQVIKVRGLLVERERRHSNNKPMDGKEYDQRIRGILSTEQYKKFADLRQQKMEQRHHSSTNNTTKPADPKKDWDDVYN